MTSSPRVTARVAGAWYLVAMAVGMFADPCAHGRLVVPGDAVSTARNIAASEWLFRVGTAGHLIVFAGDIVLLVALYVILRPLHRAIARVAASWLLVRGIRVA